MGIVFRDVVKQYPNAASPAINHVSLEIKAGEFVVLLGPSGCGKTTLLKMVNRLYEPTSGTIEIDGRDIRTIPAETLRRGIGYVIQQNGLFPHMTVEDNIAVVPRLLKWDKKKISERVDELLNLMHLDPQVFRKRRPSQLSGGQQQRVGIARAMAADPQILLMDEPFGAIDAITRTSLQDELHRIQRQLKKTVLFVTHDVSEAFRLADRIVILQAGKVVQVGTPFEIMANPANDFVRQLVGERGVFNKMKLLRVRDVYRHGEPGGTLLDDRSVSLDDDLLAAFEKMIDTGARELPVVDEEGRRTGELTLDQILVRLKSPGERKSTA